MGFTLRSYDKINKPIGMYAKVSKREMYYKSIASILQIVLTDQWMALLTKLSLITMALFTRAYTCVILESSITHTVEYCVKVFVSSLFVNLEYI